MGKIEMLDDDFREVGEPPNLGHNNPPDDAAVLKEQLEARYGELTARRDELLDAAKRAPVIDGPSAASKVADFIKMLSTYESRAEATRKQEKDVYLRAGRVVDSFFSDAVKAVSEAKGKLKGDLLRFQQAQAEAERKRRAEEEARARAAAEAAARRAQEQAAAMDSETDLASAIKTEEAAQLAASEAAKAAAATQAKPAELARARGEYGAVASLRYEWKCIGFDRAELDLERLSEYLEGEAISKAIRAFIRDGGRELRGAKIKKVSSIIVS